MKERLRPMKKIMTMMLGLTLLTGAVSVAFAQAPTDTNTEGKKKGKKNYEKKGGLKLVI